MSIVWLENNIVFTFSTGSDIKTNVFQFLNFGEIEISSKKSLQHQLLSQCHEIDERELRLSIVEAQDSDTFWQRLFYSTRMTSPVMLFKLKFDLLHIFLKPTDAFQFKPNHF